MATTMKDVNTGHNFQKTGVIKDARINPLSGAQRTTLAASLGAGHIGLLVTDSTTGLLLTWNGTAFVDAVATSQSGLTPKGSKAYNATEPGSPVIGDLYVFSSAGTNTWGGGSNVVQINDQVFWDGAAWEFLQGNTIDATESVPGILAIATQAETNTGSNDTKAVTPLKLTTFAAAKKYAKVYFAAITLVADTPLTVNHALGLQNRDAFTYNFMLSNSATEVDVDSTDTNNLTVTSNIACSGNITVIGF